MQIGLFAPAVSPAGTPEYLRTLGTAAEEHGFHSLWMAEHVVLFDDYASHYPYAADGRIPASGESGFLDPFDALASWPRTRRASGSARASASCRSGTPSTPRRRSPPSTGSRVAASTSAWASAGSPRSFAPSTCPSSAVATAAASTWR